MHQQSPVLPFGVGDGVDQSGGNIATGGLGFDVNAVAKDHIPIARIIRQRDGAQDGVGEYYTSGVITRMLVQYCEAAATSVGYLRLCRWTYLLSASR